jgi:hypothetical protein
LGERVTVMLACVGVGGSARPFNADDGHSRTYHQLLLLRWRDEIREQETGGDWRRLLTGDGFADKR